MDDHRTFSQPVSRRKALAGGLAVGGAVWVTPSVVGLDRVAAAVGSCGAAPVRVDWTPQAGLFPTSVTATDGTVVTITKSDPFFVADLTLFGLVFGGTLNGLDDPLIMAMENATNGAGASIRFNFSKPVQLCFNLVDVDQATFAWEDTIEIIGTNGGAPVNLTAADISTGLDNTVIGVNTVRGIGPTDTATGNIEVSYPAKIDQLIIEHRDDSPDFDFQFIGIHDFLWC